MWMVRFVTFVHKDLFPEEQQEPNIIRSRFDNFYGVEIEIFQLRNNTANGNT